MVTRLNFYFHEDTTAALISASFVLTDGTKPNLQSLYIDFSSRDENVVRSFIITLLLKPNQKFVRNNTTALEE